MSEPAKSSGRCFRDALASEQPLQVAGTINAYSAMLAEKAGFQAIYLSGSGVATASYGIPDLGMTSLQDVLEDVRRITSVTRLPLLVDADTGWGGAFNIARTIREMESAGAAGVHLEDQMAQKRCGHRPNKALVSKEEMEDRLKAAVDGRGDESFVIMARTDAYAGEGLGAALERVSAYKEAGADMIFAEAVSDITHYQKFADVGLPVLANMTEFGKTELYTKDQLGNAGVSLVLYPLSAFRAMSKAALNVYASIRSDGTQKNTLSSMQTREELYEVLNYHEYERHLDRLYGKED